MIIESIAGTLFGILGTGVTSFVNFKMKKLELEESKAKREHELSMVRAESEARIKEIEANVQVTQVQTEGAILLEEARAFTESQKVGNEKIFESKWVTALMNRKDNWRFLTVPIAVLVCILFAVSDLIQSLMRPLLTLYSVAIATWVTLRSWDILQATGMSFTTAQAIGQWNTATSVAVTLAVTLITWWFGDRRVAKNMMHQEQYEREAQCR
jgi:hypothetical protein